VAQRGGGDPSGRLDTYAARRQLAITPEPAPQPAAAPAGSLLFVVRQHAARQRHYNFRLELDGVLKSWAEPKVPALDPDLRRLAVETEDHPFGYASFEGVIPAGQYGAGEVIVWDCGIYAPDEHDTAGNATWWYDRGEAERRIRTALAPGPAWPITTTTWRVPTNPSANPDKPSAISRNTAA
jgi:bifunctional non-homologous end joining protein LigD